MSVELGYTKNFVERINVEISKAVINQENLTNLALTSILSGGHILLEGVPGLGKTLWVKSLAKAVSVDFNRVQFTSDIMPADILGTKIFDMKTSEFNLKKGPLFTNLFLADEINRTPPKTQSALLQVMEERMISIDSEHSKMENPFMVIATQNPVEYEGTYPLPEALLDRFMMKILLDYPGVANEKTILEMYHNGFRSDNLESTDIRPVGTSEDFDKCKEEIQNVTVNDSIFNYIISIIETTRRISTIAIGASPRGSITLLLCAKSFAAINGRDYVIPDDVKELAPHILRHRIILKPEAEIDGVKTDDVINNILAQVKVPR